VATGKRKNIGRTKSEAGQPASPAEQAGFLSSLQRIAPARAIILICLFSFLAYANSLGGDFVFDDTDQIVENQNVRSWDNLAKAFTTHVWAFRERSTTLNEPPPLPYYRPLFTVMLTVAALESRTPSLTRVTCRFTRRTRSLSKRHTRMA